jgi:pimeloyl-ACP methyl ester carboxylesterase
VNLKLFVVPGICCSQLTDTTGGHDLVWIDPAGLALNDDFLALERKPADDGDAAPGVHIEAAGFLPLLYDTLVAALDDAFDTKVERVPYDWRRNIRTIGAAFADRLRAVLAADAETQVAIVAHSMGGLVVADAIARLSSEEVARVAGTVTLGTPWLGGHDAVLGLTLAGVDPEGFAPLRLGLTSIQSILQTFRALIELVPPDDPQVLDPALYAPGPLASDPHLQRVLAESVNLVRRPPPRTFALVSDSFLTVNGLTRSGPAVAWKIGPGDGIVPFASGTAGVADYERVNASHMGMPMSPAVIGKVIGVLSTWLGRPHGLVARALEALAASGAAPTTPAMGLHGPLVLLARMPFLGGVRLVS